MEQYYEVIVTYMSVDSEKVRELYLIKAQTCSDAEYKLQEHLLVSDANVLSVKLTPIIEVHRDDMPFLAIGKWYRCKASLITVQDNGKSKRTSYYYAILAETVDAANGVLSKLLFIDNGGIGEWEINTITETKIIAYI